MFVKDRHYKVIERDSKYRMIQDYVHLEWLSKRPPMIGGDRTGDPVPNVTLHGDSEEGVLTLHRGFEWNGSNIVRDSPECMRASAIHDAWCKAMKTGQLREVEENWDRGAQEYAAICLEDGLEGWRATSREAAINFYGDAVELTRVLKDVFGRVFGSRSQSRSESGDEA